MQRSDMAADVHVFLRAANANPHSYGMGYGIVELCRRVEEMGSLSKASRDMGMAYSKAWRIVKNAEESLGVKLFVRQGANGSVLTEEAKALVALYRQMEEELSRVADQMLDKAFESFKEQNLFSLQSDISIETEATPDLIAQVRSLELQFRHPSRERSS